MTKQIIRSWFIALLITSTTVPAVLADSSDDSWEGFNRAMFSFNEGLDKYALKPAAQGYKAVMPDIAEKGVSNFFSNLADIGNFINNLLQFKLNAAGQDIARLAFNSTVGLGGLIDVASPMGIEKHHEDFGQTLGYWGIGSGPYLVLPFLGPKTLRSGIGTIPDTLLDPVYHVDNDKVRGVLAVTRVLDGRANLLGKDALISGDRYTFIRDAYLQKRQYEIEDGDLEDYDSDNF